MTIISQDGTALIMLYQYIIEEPIGGEFEIRELTEANEFLEARNSMRKIVIKR